LGSQNQIKGALRPYRSAPFCLVGVCGFSLRRVIFCPEALLHKERISDGPLFSAAGKAGRRKQQHEAVEKSRPRKSFFRGLL
ncbi:MAG: hypothetical protein ACLR39_05200, partial [Oscillospiraceae bacterium]